MHFYGIIGALDWDSCEIGVKEILKVNETDSFGNC